MEKCLKNLCKTFSGLELEVLITVFHNNFKEEALHCFSSPVPALGFFGQQAAAMLS